MDLEALVELIASRELSSCKKQPNPLRRDFEDIDSKRAFVVQRLPSERPDLQWTRDPPEPHGHH